MYKMKPKTFVSLRSIQKKKDNTKQLILLIHLHLDKSMEH